MMEEGLPEEVQGLFEEGYGPELVSMQGIGFERVFRIFTGSRRG